MVLRCEFGTEGATGEAHLVSLADGRVILSTCESFEAGQTVGLRVELPRHDEIFANVRLLYSIRVKKVVLWVVHFPIDDERRIRGALTDFLSSTVEMASQP